MATPEPSPSPTGIFRKFTRFINANLSASIIGGIIATLLSTLLIHIIKKWLTDPKAKQSTITVPHADSLSEKIKRDSSIRLPLVDSQKHPVAPPVVYTDSLKNTPRSGSKVAPAYDFAVMTMSNDRPDGPLAMRVMEWLKKNHPGTAPSTRRIVLDKTAFNRLADGYNPEPGHLQQANASRYICLVRNTVEYQASEIAPSLTMANSKYVLVIIETATGKLIHSSEKLISAPEVNKDLARQRADSLFAGYLNTQTLHL
jgi:hypothetical protein